MQIGTSLFLIAVGAILKYAVNDRVNDVDLSTVGVILMVVGIAGLVLSLIMLAFSDRDRVTRREVVEHDLPPRY